MTTIRPTQVSLFILACALVLLAPAVGAQTRAPAAPPLATVGTPNAIAEFDLNADGEVDYRVVYDKKGKVLREELDFNYDGAMDTFYYYLDGVLIRQEIDSDNDGKVDIWVYILDGQYVQRYERDTDGDGKPDVVRTFGGG